MAKEIERKFLVAALPLLTGAGVPIRQAYLSRSPTVRIRVAGENAFLTLKGPPTGISRDEFEYEIPIGDAFQLLALAQGSIIEKTRYLVDHGGHTWELDLFHGQNDGLVVAEIELQSETEAFGLPEWVSQEVTDDPRYSNAALSVTPFSKW